MQRKYTIFFSGKSGKRLYSSLSSKNLSGFICRNKKILVTERKKAIITAFVYQQDTDNSGTIWTSIVPVRNWEMEAIREQGHTDYYHCDFPDPGLSGKKSDLQQQPQMLYDGPEGFCGVFPYRLQNRPQCAFCLSSDTDVPLLRDSCPVCGRLSGHARMMYIGKKSGDTIEISADKTVMPGQRSIWMVLGWMPLEMTPDYYGVMEEADLTAGLEAKGAR